MFYFIALLFLTVVRADAEADLAATIAKLEKEVAADRQKFNDVMVDMDQKLRTAAIDQLRKDNTDLTAAKQKLEDMQAADAQAATDAPVATATDAPAVLNMLLEVMSARDQAEEQLKKDKADYLAAEKEMATQAQDWSDQAGLNKMISKLQKLSMKVEADKEALEKLPTDPPAATDAAATDAPAAATDAPATLFSLLAAMVTKEPTVDELKTKIADIEAKMKDDDKNFSDPSVWGSQGEVMKVVNDKIKLSKEKSQLEDQLKKAEAAAAPAETTAAAETAAPAETPAPAVVLVEETAAAADTEAPKTESKVDELKDKIAKVEKEFQDINNSFNDPSMWQDQSKIMKQVAKLIKLQKKESDLKSQLKKAEAEAETTAAPAETTAAPAAPVADTKAFVATDTTDGLSSAFSMYELVLVTMGGALGFYAYRKVKKLPESEPLIYRSSKSYV